MTSSIRQDVCRKIEDCFKFPAKEEQVTAIETLVKDREDVILVAKTGFGKSIIFQAVPLMFDNPKTALIIMPLKALEDEQCEKLSRIQGCRPFVLNGDSNSPSNQARIRAGEFTHGR